MILLKISVSQTRDMLPNTSGPVHFPSLLAFTWIRTIGQARMHYWILNPN